jgi:hypothetical protein
LLVWDELCWQRLVWGQTRGCRFGYAEVVVVVVVVRQPSDEMLSTVAQSVLAESTSSYEYAYQSPINQSRRGEVEITAGTCFVRSGEGSVALGVSTHLLPLRGSYLVLSTAYWARAPFWKFTENRSRTWVAWGCLSARRPRGCSAYKFQQKCSSRSLPAFVEMI